MIAEWERTRSLWEREMTICIAAVCNRSREGGAKIILCSDWRETHPFTGAADTVHKQPWLPENWVCLTAGQTAEINAVIPLLRKAFHDAGTVDETNVGPLVIGCLRSRLDEKRDALSYARFSKPYREIYDSGKEKLPSSDFSRFVSDISEVRIDAEFIIAGICNDDDFLLKTNSRAEPSYPNHLACIGDGAFLADASLRRRSLGSTRDFGPALYEVYEAKKAAESLPTVGNSTLVSVLEIGRKRSFRIDELNKFLDNLYSQYGPKQTPILMPLSDDLFW
jgi:hypothetical protein